MDPILTIPYLIFVGMNIIDRTKQFFIELARANFKQEYEGIAFILETSITTLLGIFWLITYQSLTIFALAYFIGSSIAALYIWINCKSFMPSTYRINGTLTKQLIRKMLPYTAFACLTLATLSIDTLMIQLLIGSTAVGLFHSGLKITEIIVLFPSIFGQNIFPFVSKYNTKPERIERITQQTISVIALIACPMIAGLFTLATPIFSFIYSTEFMPAIPVFKLLIISTIPLFITRILNQIQLAGYQQTICAVNAGISFILNILLSWLFILSYGILGAAIGTLIARMIHLVLTVITIHKQLPIHRIFTLNNLIYIALSILMTGALIAASQVIANPFILIAIGSIVYLLLLIITNDPHLKKVTTILSQR